MHPRLAHMMLKAKALSLGYEASLLAALISEKDIYRNAFGSSDLRERISILHDVQTGEHTPAQTVDLQQCRYLLKNARRIEKREKDHIDLEMIGVLLAFAYPDRVAKTRGDKSAAYLLVNGKGAMLHQQDELYTADFLVVADLDAKRSNATIYRAAALTQAQIEEHLHEQIRIYDDLIWSDEQQRVEARSVSKLGAITLKSVQIHDISEEKVIEVLIEELQKQGLEALSWSREALSLKQRVVFLPTHGVELPDFSNEALLKTMELWLAPYLAGIRTLKACQNLDLHPILLGLLGYEEKQLLDRLAPAKLKVASGSKIAIDYSDPQQPLLAVRLQEMFGTKTTPTVLNGKVTLMLHLLSPASRPMQVTMDLENFWNDTYHEVKKELQGKYKKHYWPDDPFTAVATNRTKKRMKQ
jgi:ATP-dependent helicase HrpB